MTSSADPHLPQPLWFKDYAVDVEQADPDSMLTLYHAALAIRQESLTATRDTTAEQVDMGPDVVAYTRAAVGGRTFTSITNFGTEPVELPGGSVVLTSGPLTPDGLLVCTGGTPPQALTRQRPANTDSMKAAIAGLLSVRTSPEGSQGRITAPGRGRSCR